MLRMIQMAEQILIRTLVEKKRKHFLESCVHLELSRVLCVCCRLWQDVTYNLTHNNIDEATAAKHKLEQRQREEAKERKEAGVRWQTKVWRLEFTTGLRLLANKIPRKPKSSKKLMLQRRVFLQCDRKLLVHRNFLECPSRDCNDKKFVPFRTFTKWENTGFSRIHWWKDLSSSSNNNNNSSSRCWLQIQAVRSRQARPRRLLLLEDC